jgi:hypothetical protein
MAMQIAAHVGVISFFWAVGLFSIWSIYHTLKGN